MHLYVISNLYAGQCNYRWKRDLRKQKFWSRELCWESNRLNMRARTMFKKRRKQQEIIEISRKEGFEFKMYSCMGYIFYLTSLGKCLATKWLEEIEKEKKYLLKAINYRKLWGAMSAHHLKWKANRTLIKIIPLQIRCYRNIVFV